MNPVQISASLDRIIDQKPIVISVAVNEFQVQDIGLCFSPINVQYPAQKPVALVIEIQSQRSHRPCCPSLASAGRSSDPVVLKVREAAQSIAECTTTPWPR